MSLNNWFRPAILKMKGYSPGEQPKNPATIKLNTNENPYAPSKAVLKAIQEQANPRLRLYPEPTADTLRKRLSQIYRWPVEGILVGNGSDEILAILFRATLGKGALVQFPDLTYSLYPILAQMQEARIKEVKLDSNFDLDFKRFSPNARLTLWGYPNPPVGNCFDQTRMKFFLQKAKGLVLIDEAYVDFSNQNCLNLARRYPNTLVLRTMSKSFSLAGVRLGVVFGHPRVIEQLMKVKDSYNVNRISQAAGLAALSPAGLKDMKTKIKKIKKERNTLMEALRHLGFTVPKSQANFFIAIRKGRPSPKSLYKNLKRKRILVRYFSHPRLRDSLRITVGAPAENSRLLMELKKLIRVLETVMGTRAAIIKRKTKETDILLNLDLDGKGVCDVKTPVPFLSHMLEAFGKHSGFNLTLRAKGDTHIDDHHTVEDIGICLGQALEKALGDKKGITRFGHSYVPLDEALVRAVVDLSGRSHIQFALDLMVKKRIGNFDTELVEDFFDALVENGKFNLHLEKIHGRNNHHIVEAAFKSFARALKMAVAFDAKVKGIPSTKGYL